MKRRPPSEQWKIPASPHFFHPLAKIPGYVAAPPPIRLAYSFPVQSTTDLPWPGSIYRANLFTGVNPVPGNEYLVSNASQSLAFLPCSPIYRAQPLPSDLPSKSAVDCITDD